MNTTDSTATHADIKTLDVTVLEPKMKHPTIFEWFDALQPGEAFNILNDHDPKPLYYQLIAERGNVFSWHYDEKGPTWWSVQIKKNNTGEGQTLGELAAEDLRKAEVFKKFGLDFCCGGKKSLKQACSEKNIDPAEVERELVAVSQQGTNRHFDYNQWELDFLADYIYNQHHKYYYNERSTIAELVQKIASHHGETNPQLVTLANLYFTLQNELNAHFIKEERVLFPHIKKLVEAQRAGTVPAADGLQDINGPIQVMEADHDAAGDILAQMRTVTNDYTLPGNACNSVALTFQKLQALEEDLHLHIHLENNILFPKAALLEKRLLQSK
jgi:regulator of cell morphogenesis and NO signaling